MIDISLTDIPVNLSDYKVLDNKSYPILCLGFIIKNQYDNERIKINTDYNPVSILHKNIPFKGIMLTPSPKIRDLFKVIKDQEKNRITLKTYENILNQFNFSCKHTYAYFSDHIYPIDFENLKSVCIDSFNTDKKIFQHILNIDEKIFDFQKFSSLKLFILTV